MGSFLPPVGPYPSLLASIVVVWCFTAALYNSFDLGRTLKFTAPIFPAS